MFQTDKQHYLRNYLRYFSGLESVPMKLLEIGVFKGGSIEMWRSLFPAWEITGIDIDLSRCEKTFDKQVALYEGNQSDLKFLQGVANLRALHGFDLIIDDGSHIAADARKTFWNMFTKHLKPGGVYFVEDWGTGYWDDWPDGSSTEMSGMVKFAKELIDEAGAIDSSRTTPKTAGRPSMFEFVHFYPGLIAIGKPK